MRRPWWLLLALAMVIPMAALAQGRGPNMHQPEKRIPFNLLKDSIERMSRLEERLAEGNKLGSKERKALAAELKEVREQVAAFLADLESRKSSLPAYDCCPCRPEPQGKDDGRKPVEVTINIQGTVPPVEPPPPVEVAPPPPEPMAQARFGALLTALGEQAFADDKLTVLGEAARHGRFSVAQVKEVIKQFSFPDDKLSALRQLRDLIVDPENNYQLYGSFVHSSDKEEARKILEAR